MPVTSINTYYTKFLSNLDNLIISYKCSQNSEKYSLLVAFLSIKLRTQRSCRQYIQTLLERPLDSLLQKEKKSKWYLH